MEDEIRERNRGIALLQTKLQYTEQENTQLTELCNKLKLVSAPSATHGGAADIIDTLLNQQVLPSADVSEPPFLVNKIVPLCSFLSIIR